MATDKDTMKDAFEQFKQASDAESENRNNAKDDIRFARLAEQWDESIRQQREREGRPMLTINRMPAFARQVINDARLNKPSILVRPATGGANRLTANVFDGLIRHIQNQSSAHIAYDTGIESAVYGGFGYWRVDIDYAYDDSFDLDITIKAVENPFTVYGDPRPESYDAANWRYAFVVEDLARDAFKRRFPGAEVVDFKDLDESQADWADEDNVRIAEWWERKERKKTIVKLSDGTILDEDAYLREKGLFDAGGFTVVGSRETRTHDITHRLITAAEVLEEKPWPGCYIPIVPVYGDVVNLEGKRHFRSLIRDAKDPQRMFNYWRTTATELVALAPRVPYIGPRGAFNTDAEKWATANTKSYSHIEYDPVPGQPPPQRQPLDGGVAAGALQEALNASDDIKSVLGLFDASLGARSNETSGKAIMARQREGDVSTFHFIDNRDRAIEYTGKVLVDLIPKVYTGERIITVLGEDLRQESTVQLGVPQQVPQPDGAPPITHVFDLTAGKYAVVIKKGASYTTKREEAAAQQIEFAKVTGAGGLFADVIAKNMDWPGADVIEERVKRSLPPHIVGNGPTPQEQQMMQAMQQMQQALQQAQQEIQTLKMDQQGEMADAQVKVMEVEVKREELDIKRGELQLRAAELQNEAMQLQTQMAQAGIDTKGIADAIASLNDQVAQMQQAHMMLAEAATKPKRKRGRAVKQPDGTWALEAVEDMGDNDGMQQTA